MTVEQQGVPAWKSAPHGVKHPESILSFAVTSWLYACLTHTCSVGCSMGRSSHRSISNMARDTLVRVYLIGQRERIKHSLRVTAFSGVV